MKTNAIILQNAIIKKVSIECTLVPGIPRIDFLGIPLEKRKDLYEKIKLWLRLSGHRLPTAKRLLFSVQPTLEVGTVVGLDLAIWLSFVSQLEKKRLVNGFYSGDFSLLGESVENLYFENLLRAQSLTPIYSTHTTKQTITNLQSLSQCKLKQETVVDIEEKFFHLLKEKRVLILTNGSADEAESFSLLLKALQSKKQKVLYHLNHKKRFQAYMDAIYFIDDLEIWSKPAMERLHTWIKEWQVETIFVKVQVCPCGKRLEKRREVSCKYTKADCQSYLKRLKAQDIALFDYVLSLSEISIDRRDGKNSIGCSGSNGGPLKKFQLQYTNKHLIGLSR